MLDGREFQQWFAQAIMARRAPADIPAAFAVYRNSWLQGLLDALGSNYPTVAMLLGDELFEKIALEFARDHPATTPALALYGEKFPEFLALHEAGREIPYLRDVAQLERLWTECFFAPDAPVLEEQDYARLTPSQLVSLEARVHPAARIARFETPAVTIWQAHRADEAFEEFEPEWKAERALVTRGGGGVAVTLIDGPTFHMLTAIRNGRSLGAAIGATAEAHPEADLSKALATVISTAALAVRRLEDDRIW
ncbi:MAG: DUF2063 domain-containing protein [Sphingomonas sp.]|nr:DUF2063 domain-containing protein [Sphingomonas sp.]